MLKKSIIISLTCIAITVLPILAGGIDADAYALVSPGKIYSLSAKTDDRDVTLSWAKADGSVTGYRIYRNDKRIATVDDCQYTDTKRSRGKTYKYKVKAYRKYKKTQWYNRKTHKWQYKKIKDAKTRKITKYLYGSASKTVKVTIQPGKVTGLTAEDDKSTVKLKWTVVNSAEGYVVYRDGKEIGSSTDATYKDKHVHAGETHTYVVRAFVYYKVLRWWNTETEEWQASKPPESIRGGSTYLYKYKLGKTSDQCEVEIPDEIIPEPEDQVFNEYTDITYDFLGTEIHLGQKWDEALRTEIEAKSDGIFELTRAKCWYDYGVEAKKDTEVYLYNTNTYAPFLAVYVKNNQIVQWITNDEIFGSEGDQTVRRGDSSEETPKHMNTRFPKEKSELGMYIGGFATEDGHECYDWDKDVEKEKTVTYHFINAFRVAAGCCILVRSSYLEGVDLVTGENKTWTGVIPPDPYINLPEIICENQRYGAQAWAETMYASDVMSHNSSYMTDGPCKNGTYRDKVQLYASREEVGYAVDLMGENISKGGSGVGERVLLVYAESINHLWTMLNSDFRSIGLGICGEYTCEQYGLTSEFG